MLAAGPFAFAAKPASIGFVAIAWLTLLWPEAALGQERYTVMARAWAEFRRELLVETAGVFWIAAELAILFGMTVAVRLFSERPVPDTLRLRRDEMRQAWAFGGVLAALCAVVYGRHLLFPPLPLAFESIGASGEDVFARAEAAYYAWAHTHIALWCALVVAWMALEAAIVVQGIRAFRRLRALAGERGRAA